jgi:hypothetical protein
MVITMVDIILINRVGITMVKSIPTVDIILINRVGITMVESMPTVDIIPITIKSPKNS